MLAGVLAQARSRREGARVAVSDQHGRAPAFCANIGGSVKWPCAIVTVTRECKVSVCDSGRRTSVKRP